MDDALDRPKLRPGIVLGRHPRKEGAFLLEDQLRLARPVGLTPFSYECLKHFDGGRTLVEILDGVSHKLGEATLDESHLRELVSYLDGCLLLDSPRFHDRLFGPVRSPACIGTYPDDPDTIRTYFAELMAGNEPNPGSRIEADGRARGILAPHMDYERGRKVYPAAFKELVERTDAELFIVIATSHHSGERFTLTRQHFTSPLGMVETDIKLVNRLAKLYGEGLFNDPVAHLPEHSIELEVVLLQYLLEGKRKFRILPLLVGSFGDCVAEGTKPGEHSDIRRMAEALRQIDAELKQPACYIISGDLAHIGPKFDDPDPVDERMLADGRNKDERILEAAAAGNANAYFEMVAAEGDSRRICGMPPTTLFLEALRPSRGKVLAYDQYAHPDGFESVSFAAMVFDA